MNNFLFVYGSLSTDDNEFAIYLRQNSRFVANATFKGILYDVSEYPGAILDDNGYDIQGVICELFNSAASLKVLDEYEGFGEAEEQPNLFVRTNIETTTPAGAVECWVYLYNLPVANLTEITTGNYTTYLKQKTLRGKSGREIV